MKRSPFEFSDDNKRYHTLNYYNRSHYGHKIYKAVLDCGFSCPNIDGTKGTGGCIFCDGGSGYFTHGGCDIISQLAREKERICGKYGESARFVAYFQANTNTYAPAEVLRKLYYSVLDFPNVCGISIGTRADCLSDEIVGLLAELSSKTDLTVELGMQSCHESTIKLINRCYTHEEFCEGFYKLRRRKIRTCIHIINGLPFETPEMMLKTAAEAVRLAPEAVKLQMLHVIKGTVLAEMYERNEFELLERDEYIGIIAKQLEILPPETVIERITGDGDKSKLIAPMWSADKIAVLGGIDKRLAELDTWQGKKYEKKA
ncbi:MAG: TIGR01212 family radical SAM protein [Ruminococcus sp.]|uniref:TIGR01212 family radical SAM protein n=1 Tax=Ruminococcus sp. TaxID=41978 RepID=UPI0025D9BBA2|nr:TIGR01212 family radical SAM protein [Ruminococcus sp.]MBR5682299.1 TIGR01212 family radical SAM protein [Ruminococcus sp.]